MVKRIILIVMDSLGVGAMPDANLYKNSGHADTEADTFGHIAQTYGDIKIPNLKRLGFCNIDGVLSGKMAVNSPIGAFGRLKEKSKGKDTITGHWEIAGIYTEIPFKTYPDGFPKDFIESFEKAIGIEILGNYASSGTEIIETLGEEHETTGKPIVYTSADSVFQIAACVDVIPLKRLYEICQTARDMLVGDMSCGRVIARPYKKENGKRIRTSDRKDYAVSPPEETVLDKIVKTGKRVYAIGKIRDIFNGRGISESVHTKNNADGVKKTVEAVNKDFEGLIFTNLVDFDSKYGHRRDPVGYGKDIEEFDSMLPEIMGSMKPTDMLILCADHGNDPTYFGWDHTREYIPAVLYGDMVKAGINLGTRNSFADIGATVADLLRTERTAIGDSFAEEILKD